MLHSKHMKAATFVRALNGASILALSTIDDLRLSKTGRTVVGRTFDWMEGRSDAVSRLAGSFLNVYYPAQKANGQPPYIYIYICIYTHISTPQPDSKLCIDQCSLPCVEEDIKFESDLLYLQCAQRMTNVDHRCEATEIHRYHRCMYVD